MIAASLVNFTGWMAALAVALAVIAWWGVTCERRKAERVFKELIRAREGASRWTHSQN